jgi:hypothetical protein
VPYPAADLENDALDPLYGGQPGSAFGAPAWEWINNVVRVLSRGHLLHNRQPFRTVAPEVTQAVQPGDVVVVRYDASGAPSGGYTARKAESGDATEFAAGRARVLGVCIVGAAGGSRAVVATAGIVPRTYTGIGTAASSDYAALYFATGRLRVAVPGDTVLLGQLDTRGNLHLSL